MPEDHYLEDFPSEEIKPSQKNTLQSYPAPADSHPAGDPIVTDPSEKNRLAVIWDGITRLGLAETTLRLGTHALLVALILIVAWAMRQFYLKVQPADATYPGVREAALAASLPTATPTELPPNLPPLQTTLVQQAGVNRRALLHTDIPSLPRVDVISYTVQTGDTVFGIAEKFGLKPQTILWANYTVLGDNPHKLSPNQVLNILPVDGTYHRWSQGDGLNGVAKFFGVSPDDIISYPGNHLDPATVGDPAHPNIAAGTWLIIPGGKRDFISWSAPAIPRNDPGVARVLGPGVCGAVADGAIGSGAFIWPAPNHFLSGFDYAPEANHPGIDIDGDLGQPVYAADNGVVVYAGWNNWGYGNMVVINHGNGWQTLYAHLSAYNVSCGSSVLKGSVIGAIGSTGNSTGPHLHFEMMNNGTKVNPHNYLP
ncbi:MAG TPA: M23 family metallopeptidase [Anaerolineales bacterium]